MLEYREHSIFTGKTAALQYTTTKSVGHVPFFKITILLHHHATTPLKPITILQFMF